MIRVYIDETEGAHGSLGHPGFAAFTGLWSGAINHDPSEKRSKSVDIFWMIVNYHNLSSSFSSHPTCTKCHFWGWIMRKINKSSQKWISQSIRYELENFSMEVIDFIPGRNNWKKNIVIMNFAVYLLPVLNTWSFGSMHGAGLPICLCPPMSSNVFQCLPMPSK